jgi:hypothetical protein
MDNTPFSKKVEILGDYYAIVCEQQHQSAFVQEHRDTLMFCLASIVKWVTIEQRYHPYVESAWNDFCETLQVDPYGNYPSPAYMLEFANAEG